MYISLSVRFYKKFIGYSLVKCMVAVIARIVPKHGAEKFVFENVVTFQTY